MNAQPSSLTQVLTQRTGKKFTISVRGRFDFGCHQAFRHAFEQVTATDDVVVDLGMTEYLDSSALGMLLVLKDAVPDKTIQIAGCNPSVKRILGIANFDRIFTVT